MWQGTAREWLLYWMGSAAGRLTVAYSYALPGTWGKWKAMGDELERMILESERGVIGSILSWERP